MGPVVRLIDHRKVASTETLPFEAQILIQEVAHHQKESLERRRDSE